MITFVSISKVFPEKHKDSLRAIQNFYTKVIKHQPGFISARLLINDNGTKITVISLWQTQEQLTNIKLITGFQDFDNPELFKTSISIDADVYSNFIEVTGVLHKHKRK